MKLKIAFILGWLICGVLNIMMIAKYGNHKPMGIAIVSTITLMGPPLLVLVGVIIIITEADKNICILNCGATK